MQQEHQIHLAKRIPMSGHACPQQILKHFFMSEYVE